MSTEEEKASIRLFDRMLDDMISFDIKQGGDGELRNLYGLGNPVEAFHILLGTLSSYEAKKIYEGFNWKEHVESLRKDYEGKIEAYRRLKERGEI